MIVVELDSTDYVALCVSLFDVLYKDVLRHDGVSGWQRRHREKWITADETFIAQAVQRVSQKVRRAVLSGAVWHVGDGIWAFRDEGVLGLGIDCADDAVINLFLEHAEGFRPTNN